MTNSAGFTLALALTLLSLLTLIVTHQLQTGLIAVKLAAERGHALRKETVLKPALKQLIRQPFKHPCLVKHASPHALAEALRARTNPQCVVRLNHESILYLAAPLAKLACVKLKETPKQGIQFFLVAMRHRSRGAVMLATIAYAADALGPCHQLTILEDPLQSQWMII